jgi:hypothetical protein
MTLTPVPSKLRVDPPHLPFPLPNATRSRRLGIGVGVFGSAAATAEWFGAFELLPSALHLVILAPTCLLIGLLLWVATRPALSRPRGLWNMALGVPLGALNGLVIALCLCIGGGSFREPGVCVAAAAFGGAVAVPYTLALLPLVDRCLLHCRQRTHDAHDRLRVGAGIWLLAVGVLCGYHHFVRSSPGLLSDAGGLSPALLPASLSTLVGFVLAAAGSFSLFRKHRWLRAVCRGGVTGWRVVPASAHVPRRDLAPFLAGEPSANAWLAWVRPREGAYRDADETVPVALVAQR